MKAVKKFYLNKHIEDQKVQAILRYLKDFGQGSGSAEREGSEAVLYVGDLRDAELVKSEFPELIDAQADLIH
jgi:hypothetical protein